MSDHPGTVGIKPAMSSVGPLSVGLQEEYLLVEPRSGLPVPAADAVRAAARLQPALGEEEVQRELLQVQLLVGTPACDVLDEVGGHLLRVRHELSCAAEALGHRLLACGASPVSDGEPARVTDSARYRARYADAPQLVDEQLVNGLAVRVGVPDREEAVQVVNRLRPWLPVLVAMAANSPLWLGRNTGFASWRTVHAERWPVQGPPPVFAHLADYDLRAEALVACGVVRDRGALLWHARVSEVEDTVEVRATDVQLRADDSVMVAGLVRALVATALHDERTGVPCPQLHAELARAASWHAARHGLDDELIDPVRGVRGRAGDVVLGLLDHVGPALDAHGDRHQVTALVERLLREGTGADRQRRAFADGGLRAVIDLLAGESVAT